MVAIANLVHQTSESLGTGSFTLATVNGRNDFNNAFGVGGLDVFWYFIMSRTSAQWECGSGHLSSPTTLVRDTVLQNSLGTTAKIDFGSGGKDVTNAMPSILTIDNVIPRFDGATGAIQTSSADITDAGIMRANAFQPMSNVVPPNGMYLPAANTIGLTENSINIAASEPVTSVHNPLTLTTQVATGRRFAMLNEDWMNTGNKIWIKSDDLSIYPAVVKVTGTWAGGDVARIRFNTGAVNYDFSYTVQGGDTNAIIAGGLRTAVLANATFIALPVWVQALDTANAKFDVCFMYPQHPVTLSDNGSSTAAGTFAFTQSQNLLDGPLGYFIWRTSVGRTPVANDDVGGIFFYGACDTPNTLILYGRIETFMDNPALASAQGRMQFHTADPLIGGDALGRMILRKGLYMLTAAGGSPSGGTSGDMGGGTINTPSDAGYYVNGNGVFRWSVTPDAVQLLATANKPLELGTNNLIRLRIPANGANVHPETNEGVDIGLTTKRFGNIFLKTNGKVDFGNATAMLTHDSTSFEKLSSSVPFSVDINLNSTRGLDINNPNTGSGAIAWVQATSGTAARYQMGAFHNTGTCFLVADIGKLAIQVVEDKDIDFYTNSTVRMILENNGMLNFTGASIGRGNPISKNADFTLAVGENNIINTKGSALVVTFPSASSFPGREVFFNNEVAQQINSASSNIIPLGGGAAAAAILTANAGRWAKVVSNGTNWKIMEGVV